ncbi:hypothetical protein M569_02513 [Genlisea aurea]|uniref:Exostosin GT47 domain-containing protein n=1 Tax=Genlisea aurea TaxID=192259 RepID=S8CXP5_9LAMI|nr:hypothetical protein M569_02513 [Genlisea aurea]
MPRKSQLRPTTLAVSSLLALYALYTIVSYRQKIHPDLVVTLHRNPPPIPLKIYMYDLPRKFTYGVIESYASARGADSPPLNYPGHQHSAEWYLFSDLIRPDDDSSSVTRVTHPEEADLFYVPFFSSLSLIVNPIRPNSTASGGGRPPLYSDERTQEELMEWLEKEAAYWKGNKGRDHVFICQDPNALYKIIDGVKNGILLVSDFGRLAPRQASLVKDVILPYSHRINSYQGEIGLDGRKSLLFFMGNRYRKEGGKIRDMLFRVLENEPDVVIKHGAQSRESRRVATQGMHASRFCLHPAGDTPSACRLFDAIVSLCIPVIVSDFIELPFEDAIDYRTIAIFVDSKAAVKPGHMVKLLRKVKKYFEYDDPDGAVKEIWRQVSLKLPLVKLMINRDKRIAVRDSESCSCLCSNNSGMPMPNML